mgnify:FL=1
MADLLYGCVGVDGRRKRKQREFRSIGFTIDGYTDEELRARQTFRAPFVFLFTWEYM